MKVQPGLAGLEARFRVYRQPGVETKLTHLRDQLDRPSDLGVDGAAVSTRIAERFQVFPGVVHHQVTIEVEVAVATDPLHHEWADREVGYEVAVHHIDVQHVGLGPDAVYLVGQAGKVSRKYGRRDAHPTRRGARRHRGRVLCHGRRT
jgi:hypothetical protein